MVHDTKGAGGPTRFYFDLARPSGVAEALPPLNREHFQTVFLGQRISYFTDDEWSALLDIIETYRAQSAWLPAETRNSVALHLDQLVVSLRKTIDQLQYFVGQINIHPNLPDTISDYFNDRVEIRQASGAVILTPRLLRAELLGWIEHAQDLREELADGREVAVRGFARSDYSPWVKMVKSVWGWAERNGRETTIDRDDWTGFTRLIAHISELVPEEQSRVSTKSANYVGKEIRRALYGEKV